MMNREKHFGFQHDPHANDDDFHEYKWSSSRYLVMKIIAFFLVLFCFNSSEIQEKPCLAMYIKTWFLFGGNKSSHFFSLLLLLLATIDLHTHTGSSNRPESFSS